jgi:hypothetical protein
MSAERFTPLAISAGKPFRLRRHPPRGCRHFPADRGKYLSPPLAFDSCRPADPHHVALYASHAVAHLRSGFARDGRDVLHPSRQHTRAIARQAAVGRVVNVGFHYRRVRAHAAALHYFALHRQRHHSLMNLF